VLLRSGAGLTTPDSGSTAARSRYPPGKRPRIRGTVGRESSVDFRILGPLEVRDADRVLPIGAGKQRALLALLLVNANRTLASD
jgi:hypothetical protein